MRAKNGESTGACRSGDRKKTGDRLTSPSGQKGKMLIRSHLREETVTREEQLQTASQVLRGHCQTNLTGPAKGADLKRSGCKLTPLGQGGRTVLFEDIAAVEVAVEVEVVVD